MLYTISKIAKILKIPESTARYYIDRHPDFMLSVGSGRKKRYKKETLENLKLIVEMASKNVSTENIKESLNQTGSRTIKVQQDNNDIITMIQQQSIQQIKFIKLLDRITNQGKEIQELREKVNELKKYIDQKRLS